MTEQATTVTPVWVIDAMCLSHFARAERFDVLRDLLLDKECWTTQVVLEEVRQGVAAYPALRDSPSLADKLARSTTDSTLDEIAEVVSAATHSAA